MEGAAGEKVLANLPGRTKLTWDRKRAQAGRGQESKREIPIEITRLNMNRILFLVFLTFCCIPMLRAQESEATQDSDGATIKQGKPYSIQGDDLQLITKNLDLPFNIVVTTNGNFTVGKGSERALSEGQILKSDGWLISPDGSAVPVFDHVAMSEGRVVLVRDGDSQILTDPMTFPNGLNIGPDGSCAYPSGAHARLMDGQMFQLDGTPILSKDTISMKHGQVVVQKEGKLLYLAPAETMGMNDGTSVRGDGLMQNRDGTQSWLVEGQTLVIPGALVKY